MSNVAIESNPDKEAINWQALLAFLHAAFSYMNGRIDPPSSLHKMTAQSLRDKARFETLVLARDNGRIVGCMFCRDEGAFLYIGKVAVESERQGQGIGRKLIEQAFRIASARGMIGLELETRIELIENRSMFERLGFVKTGESSHAGFAKPTSIQMRAILESFDDDEGLS